MNLATAILLALFVHETDKDLGGAPYILHVFSVMLGVTTVDEMIVAVLHDAMEHGGVEVMIYLLISKGCDLHIIEALLAITRCEDESYGEYISRCGVNRLARRVKLADLAHNLDIGRISNPTPEDRRRLAKYQKATRKLLAYED
ncbi:hypothetical protein [Herbaspirillum huttiense]|uniref:hypothetical protein n=1 Tax=Herbaspirillum huttiense TaxID=863372 RepID=UPI0039AF3EFB